MRKPLLALLLVPLGLVLILAGALILVDPRVALWLNAGLFVGLGAWLLLFAAEIRAGAREKSQHKLSILG